MVGFVSNQLIFIFIFLIHRRPHVYRPPVHSGAPAALKTPTTNDRRTEKGRSPLSPTSPVIRHVANIHRFNPDPKPQFMTINNKMIIYTENGLANRPNVSVETGKLVTPGLRVRRCDLTECNSRHELGRLVKNKQAKSSKHMSVINL